MPCRGPDFYEDGSATISKLKEDVDNLTNILCSISRFLDNKTNNSLFALVPSYKDFIESHKVVDENRWFKKYKDQYPDFNKAEIAKMVRSGILKN
jgi:hypothetical protein